MNTQALFEAIKEPLRLLVLALLPFTIVYLNGLSYEWVAIGVLILRGIDKFLHELGKENESDNLIKGLTRF